MTGRPRAPPCPRTSPPRRAAQLNTPTQTFTPHRSAGSGVFSCPKGTTVATKTTTTPAEPVRRYVPLDAAATYLSCSTRHVRDLIARGEITGYRLGSKSVRVDLTELDDVLTVIPTGGRLAATRGGGRA